MQAQMMMERTQEYGEALAERWSNLDGRAVRGYERFGKDPKTKKGGINFLEGITDPEKRRLLSILYENALNGWLRRLDETTRAVNVGSFEKYVFPVIRAIYANLIAAELVSIQPLTAPTGLIFYFDVIYGSNKGSIRKGSKMYDARRGPSADLHFSDEVVEGEQIGTGAGGTGPFAATLAYVPVRAGTVVITDGVETFADNGAGVLTGSGGGTGAIDYATGAITALTFAVAVGVGDAITTDYEYDSEGHADVPQLDIQLTSSPVVARSNKLRARWSLEAQQDLAAYNGINAEVEVVAFMGNEIAKEINYKIIRHLRTIAAAQTLAPTPITFDRTQPTGVALVDHYAAFQQTLIEAGNTIFSATQRWNANWVLGDVQVANIMEFMPGFVAQPSPHGTAGPQRSGKLGALTVYKDPTYPTDEFLYGFKGGSYLEAGYVHAPYIGLYTTDTVVLDDFLARKGMATRTAQKVINPHYYGTGTITTSSP